jgi:hypothetical protein
LDQGNPLPEQEASVKNMKYWKTLLLSAMLTSAAACFGGHRIEQVLAPGVPDLKLVDMVEIRDAKGQVLVSGKFATSSERPQEVVRRAALTNPANDEWDGVIELRSKRDGEGVTTADDVRLKVDHLPDDTPCVVMFDTLKVADFMTNGDGTADLHMKRASLEKTYR